MTNICSAMFEAKSLPIDDPASTGGRMIEKMERENCLQFLQHRMRRGLLAIWDGDRC
jgi:hypothetical protein